MNWILDEVGMDKVALPRWGLYGSKRFTMYHETSKTYPTDRFLHSSREMELILPLANGVTKNELVG